MMSAEHFVVVDDEDDLLRSLVSALRRSRPAAEVCDFTDPVQAADHLERAPRIDALITDIRMPKLDGIELLIRARRRRPRLPAVIMTAFPSPSVVSQVASFGTVEYLDKPFSVAAFLGAIDRVMLPSAGFAGALAIEGLPDLIQLCALSSSTSALVVRHGARQGAIWFERGLVVHAQEGAVTGEQAFYEILAWKDGEFAVERGATAPARTMKQKATELLIEASRRQDESARGEGQAASLEELDEFDLESAIQEFDDFAEAVESSQPEPVAFEQPTVVTAVTVKENPMANIQSNLERLRTLDGYLGAALVDSESGMTLGVDGGGAGLNLEIAAASNTEVVRAKRKAIRNLGLKDEIDDILISLGKQYHVIRPLRARAGVFYYVVLDRARANLAMARMAIADTEKALEV
ncbi:MAG TPA: DUF4388 domain-containing protein [Kofleriaceae bacterium]|nr:DUF4388 domain-containing protein [Kofleriaceae bacterium]